MKYLKIDADGKGNGRLHWCDEESAEYALVPIAEYNGLQKALRIVRERGKQQIDREKADDNGYTLIRAERRIYDYESRVKGVYITRSTPYSIKIGLGTASFLIENDLKTFYKYVELPTFERENSFNHKESSFYAPKDVLKDYDDYFIRCKGTENIKNEWIIQRINFLRENNEGKIAFEIAKLSKNHAQGVYEVSYWATDYI